jgi:hypothetical protein
LTYRVLVGTNEAQAIAAVPEGTAQEIATVLIEGFDKHYRLFRATSGRAKERFEAGAWCISDKVTACRNIPVTTGL